jgi:hypothetical protein
MDEHELRDDDERAFERELLGSAAADGLPAEAVKAAWARFALALEATSTLTHVAPAGRAAAAKLTRGARRAFVWASLGAVSGGLVTAALFGFLHDRSATRSAQTSPRSSAAIVSTTPSVAPPAAASATTTRERVAPGPETPGSDGNAKYGARSQPPKRPATRAAAAVRSGRASTSLAAEIALLDEAREASRAGEFDHALALLDRYRREHPDGELRRESDVLTMEALFLGGDRDAATERARRFLEAFPDDPHVTRVQTFVH